MAMGTVCLITRLGTRRMVAKHRKWVCMKRRALLGVRAVFVMLGVVLLVGCGGDQDESVSRTGSSNRGARPSQDGPVVRERPSSPREAREQLTPLEIPDGVDVVSITPEQVKTERDTAVLAKVLVEAEEPKSRGQAARGLGRGRDRSALPALLEALSDDDLTVRVYAISAINDITGMKFRYAPDSPESVREQQARNLRDYLRTAGAVR